MKHYLHWYAYPILFIALFAGLGAEAQTDDAPDTPYNYNGLNNMFELVEKGDTTLYYADIISDTTLPCNLQDERFGEFIAKFQTDKDFRLSRLHESISETLQEGTDKHSQEFTYLLEPTVELVIGKRMESYEDTYSHADLKLAYIDKDNVVYHGSAELYAKENNEEFGKDEFICSGARFTWFIRVDGKWLLRSVHNFG